MKKYMLKTITTVTACAAVFSFTVTAHAAEEFVPLPGTAGSFEVSSDGTVYSFGATPRNPDADKFDYTLEEFAALHLAETNKIRVEYGLPELQTDPVLTEMAQARMVENGSAMSHERPDGSMYWTIFDEYDTSLKANGENIQGAGGTPETSARGFLQTSHRENVLRENSTHIGIAVEWVDTIVGPRIAVLQLYGRAD